MRVRVAVLERRVDELRRQLLIRGGTRDRQDCGDGRLVRHRMKEGPSVSNFHLRTPESSVGGSRSR